MSGEQQAKLRLARAFGWLEGGLQLGAGVSALGLSGMLAWAVVTSAPSEFTATNTQVFSPIEVTEPVIGQISEHDSVAAGFILLVETRPEAVQVVIDGVSRGASPVSLNYECQPGGRLSLELRHPGYATLKKSVGCGKDVMRILRARLEPLKKP